MAITTRFCCCLYSLESVYSNRATPVLMKDFMISNSRSILVQLSILKIESDDSDDWTYECTDCFTEGESILYHVLKTASNCILNNKAKNINSFTTHNQSKEPQKKILKLSSKYYVYVCNFRGILTEANHYI